MLEPLYTADEMKAAEAGHDVETLMNRAGRAVADVVLARGDRGRSVACVCGGGANGGDGRIAAELLASSGWEVELVERDGTLSSRPDVVVDALFGTGFSAEPRTEAARLIEQVNASGSHVVAVDIPSGVDASTGETPGAAIRADVTVTFHGPKVGQVVGPGRYLCGDVRVADIGLEPRETANALVTDEILQEVPRKRATDNKYTAGAVLVVGGSRGMTGAAALAARAAFRADAGYVAITAPEESLPTLETLVVEAVKRPLGDAFEAAQRARALALGPGLGREHGQLVRMLLERTDVPAVVDADALHELEPFERAGPTVLTPHGGELARLLDVEPAWVDAHRLEALRRAVERFRCVVLLKGADTLIGTPGEGVWVVGGDVPQLATAGTGDVLTGIVAAFLAKGVDARTAAAAAAAAQRHAARLAGRDRGLVAGDIVDQLGRL
jgi:hydroxyethylthiazole kinase-like uncharacterized protein yjeF